MLLPDHRLGPGSTHTVTARGGPGTETSSGGLVFHPDPAEFAALAKAHSIVPVWCEVVADTLTPVTCFANVVGEDDGFLFESVEGGERWGRYSFVGRRPLATLTARGGHVATTGRLGLSDSDEGILAAVEAMVERFQSPPSTDSNRKPVVLSHHVGEAGDRRQGVGEPPHTRPARCCAPHRQCGELGGVGVEDQAARRRLGAGTACPRAVTVRALPGPSRCVRDPQRALPRVTGAAAVLIHQDDQHIAVTVHAHLAHVLAVAPDVSPFCQYSCRLRL